MTKSSKTGRTFAAGAAVGALATAAAAAKPRWLVESDMPRTIPVETDPLTEIPTEADVVVIGAGIAGITTALYLNEFGLRTVVFEKGHIGGEASSRNFGWVYSNALHVDKLPLANLAKEAWFGLGDRFGFDVTVRRGGNLLLLSDDEEMSAQREWLREASARFPEEIDARIVTGADLDDLIPGASRQFLGALHQPSDGSAEPTHAVPLIAKGARAEGVKVFAPVAVRGVETAGGAIHSVVTELGEVRTKRVVLAGGAWSRMFLGNLGVDLPQQGIASPMMRVRGGTAMSGAGMGGAGAWREEVGGTYSIGATSHAVPVTLDSFRVLPAFLPALRELVRDLPNSPLKLKIGSDLLTSLRTPRRWSNSDVTEFERVRMLTGRPLPGAGDSSLAAVQELFPGMKDAEVIERWAGIIDATPDYTSVISEVAQVPGLVLNTGHGAQGFSFGPGAGRLAAEIVAERTPSIDTDAFRFSRFSDGSRLQIREFI